MKTHRQEFPWGTIEWLANDELGNAGELSVARMTIAPGQAIDAHLHANAEESIYVVARHGRVRRGTAWRSASRPASAQSCRGDGASDRVRGRRSGGTIAQLLVARRAFELA